MPDPNSVEAPPELPTESPIDHVPFCEDAFSAGICSLSLLEGRYTSRSFPLEVEEEFDGKSKPEEYRTKVPLSWIERRLMWVLETNDIPRESVRIQEIGDYWRKQGQDFLISKQLDITL